MCCKGLHCEHPCWWLFGILMDVQVWTVLGINGVSMYAVQNSSHQSSPLCSLSLVAPAPFSSHCYRGQTLPSPPLPSLGSMLYPVVMTAHTLLQVAGTEQKPGEGDSSAWRRRG